MYYLNLKNYDKSTEAFKKAVDVASNNAIAYYYLALIEQQKSNLQGAVDYAIKCIEANQQFAPGYQLLSQLYTQAGETDKAQQILQMMPKVAGQH
jgi:tetratricopeptide (TPR) repeat protein